MIEVDVHNVSGEKVGSVSVDPAKLGGEVRPALIKQACVMYHANQRQGSAKTKTRGEVEGSTKKLFRQKGTGNARMGTKRSPIRTHGGHAKAKQPRSFRQDMPQKQRQLAAKSALLSKLQDGEVKVLDELVLAEAKTKLMKQLMDKLGVTGTSAVVARSESEVGVENIWRAARNLPRTSLTSTRQLNAFDLMTSRHLVVSKAALEELTN